MADNIIYNTMIRSVIDTTPAVLMTISSEQKISHIYITKHSEKKSKNLIGKQFLKILKLIFERENINTIYNAYLKSLKTTQSIQLNRLDHISVRGLFEHLSCSFFPVPGQNDVVVYIQNITDSILMKDEFTSMSEQYEAVNRELCVAVSNLDFHLMDLEQAHKKIAALYRITSIVQKTVNEQEILDEILDGIARELGFSQVSILLLDEESQELRTKAHRGQRASLRIPLGRGITGYAAMHREMVYVEDVKNDARYIPVGNCEAVSELAIPLVVDEKVLGVLNVETTDGRTLQGYDIDLLRSLSSQIAMTIAHANHVAKVEMQAITDGLTGLYNYRYFRSMIEQEMKRAIRYKRPLSLLMIDIDYFKNYNDTNGHLAGDNVLQTIATLLKNCCRDVDIVVRYGGEEFAILFPETTMEEAYGVGERIRLSIAAHSFTNGHLQPEGKVTVSIGISSYPDHAHSYIELINYADIALYSAKHSSRNCTRLYSSSLESQTE